MAKGGAGQVEVEISAESQFEWQKVVLVR